MFTPNSQKSVQKQYIDLCKCEHPHCG